MRCEKPWLASLGTTKNTSASAPVTSASEAPASAGSGIRYLRPTAEIVAGPGRRTAALLGDDVLERGPADEREQRVIEPEEGEVAARSADDGGTDAADQDRDGERQEEQRQEQVPRAGDDRHRSDEGADGADADVREHDGRDRRAVDPVEEEREDGQRENLGEREKRERRKRLRDPDRAAVGRREHEAVEHALLALGHERAAEPEQRGEDDRDPEQAVRREIRRARRQREMEDDEDGDDEEQHGRERVPRAQLEQEVLARERTHVGEVVHASASCSVVNGSTLAGSWVETRNVRSPRSSPSCESSSSAPWLSSAV